MLWKKMHLNSSNQPLYPLLGNQGPEENLELLDPLECLDQKEREEGMDLMVWMGFRVLLETFSSFQPTLAQAKDPTISSSQSFPKPCKILWDLLDQWVLQDFLGLLDHLETLDLKEKKVKWEREVPVGQEAWLGLLELRENAEDLVEMESVGSQDLLDLKENLESKDYLDL
jgi:hypothetical protein